ncbi:MAG: carbamoyl-phosphate synthase small subunit, partial [Hyphomicrobiaceae bacterium]
MSFEALLVLEDGRVFRGRGLGARAERAGEVVFNTGLTGYQEIFSDPSYTGQIVVLTYPQIGNYGVNDEDRESLKPCLEGLVVREFSPIASNRRSEQSAEDYLSEAGVPIIDSIDTRALVRHLREHGAMRGIISSLDLDTDSLVAKARAFPTMAGRDLASTVSTKVSYEWTEPVPAASPSEHIVTADEKFHVVAYDFGIKHNILRQLRGIGARTTVVPAGTSAADVLALKPDGVFVSNGPGDPEPLQAQAKSIQGVIGRVPVFGICLGHQVLALASGAKTFKLKFGHHGCNHPVRNELTGKVEITSQNHGFAVDPDSLPSTDTEVTHINLNDQTLEGFRSRKDPMFCVQYHPEAAPGPHDSAYLFQQFRE